MASTYSSNLKIELIGTGEQTGTWGQTTNSNFSNVFEQSIVGRVTVNFATDANKTLSASDSVSSQDFRNVYLNLTSSGSLTATRDLIVPTINKNYIVQNNTTGSQSIRVITAAGTGITVPNGSTGILYVDGTNVIQAFDYLPTLTVPTLNVTTIDLTNLEVTNIKAKDGTASASIADSTGAFTVSAAFAANGGVTLGDASGDALTINSSAVSIPNGLNFDSNTLVIDATNNRVGVGTASPSSTLTVASSSNNAGRFTSTATTTALVLDNTHANAWGSNLAILTGGTAAGYFGTIGSLLGSTAQDLAVYASTGNGFRVYTDGNNERMRITSTGNVGIGTSAPTTRLQIDTASGTATTVTLNQSGVGAGNISVPASANALAFGVFDGVSAVTERMRINGSGNVGIGTSSPSFKLDVVGTTSQTRIRANATTAQTDFGAVNSGGALYLGLDDSTGATTGTAYASYIYSTAAKPLLFYTNGSLKATLDSSGNLGLGVTPSAWYTTNSSVAQVRQASFYAVDNSALEIGNNAYLTSGGSTWNYINTGYATRYNQSSGKHIWFTAPSGTAGTAITFTQAMTLDASGNLGIGKTSPAYKLDLYGGAIRIDNGGSAGTIYFVDTNGYINYSSSTMQFAVNGSERMRIDSSGNVGIGTSSPTFKLQVAGADTSAGGINITGSGTDGLRLFQNGSTGNSYISNTQNGFMYFGTNNTERMRIDATGNALFAQAVRATITTDNDLSFDMNAASNFKCTPTGGGALTFTNITSGQTGNIILVNGSNYAITAAATTKVSSTCLATISATGTYWLSYYSDGTSVYVANTGALA